MTYLHNNLITSSLPLWREGFGNIRPTAFDDCLRVFRHHLSSFFFAYYFFSRFHPGRKDGRSPIDGMRIRGNQMDKLMGKQFFSASLCLRPKFSSQAHGRDLTQTAHLNHLIISSGVPSYFMVSFRMSDDRDDSMRQQAEKDLLATIRNTLRIKFNHQAPIVVAYRHQFPIFIKFEKIRREMDVGAGKDPQCDCGLRIWGWGFGGGEC